MLRIFEGCLPYISGKEIVVLAHSMKVKVNVKTENIRNI
jgi:hypothetical protein